MRLYARDGAHLALVCGVSGFAIRSKGPSQFVQGYCRRGRYTLRRSPVAAAPIHSGKRNAIRAALSAGVKPTQVAKHFGLPLSDIRRFASEPGETAERQRSSGG